MSTFKTKTELEVTVGDEDLWVALTIVGEIDYTPGQFADGTTSIEDIRRIKINYITVTDVNGDIPPPSDATIISSIPPTQLFEIFWHEWMLANL